MYQMNNMPPPPPNAIADFFRKFDTDGNGLIDYQEFRQFLLKFNGL